MHSSICFLQSSAFLTCLLETIPCVFLKNAFILCFCWANLCHFPVTLWKNSLLSVMFFCKASNRSISSWISFIAFPSASTSIISCAALFSASRSRLCAFNRSRMAWNTTTATFHLNLKEAEFTSYVIDHIAQSIELEVNVTHCGRGGGRWGKATNQYEYIKDDTNSTSEEE